MSSDRRSFEANEGRIVQGEKILKQLIAYPSIALLNALHSFPASLLPQVMYAFVPLTLSRIVRSHCGSSSSLAMLSSQQSVWCVGGRKPSSNIQHGRVAALGFDPALH